MGMGNNGMGMMGGGGGMMNNGVGMGMQNQPQQPVDVGTAFSNMGGPGGNGMQQRQQMRMQRPNPQMFNSLGGF